MQMQIEIFKQHPHLPYEVSNYGRVRRKGKILKQGVNNAGYKVMQLYTRDHGRVGTLVHRLVCQTWKPNHNRFFTDVDHINRDKLDNRSVNLRWVNKNLNAMNKGRGYWKSSKNRWRSDFSILGRRFAYSFAKEEDAAKCVKISKKQLFNQVLQHYNVMEELLRRS